MIFNVQTSAYRRGFNLYFDVCGASEATTSGGGGDGGVVGGCGGGGSGGGGDGGGGGGGDGCDDGQVVERQPATYKVDEMRRP